GYTVIPQPQEVQLEGADFVIDGGWRLEVGKGVNATGVAVDSLKQEMAERYGLTLATGKQGSAVDLEMLPGSVAIGKATDKNKQALEEQAYRLALNPKGIRITANAPAGLFYGVETLVQLVKPAKGKLWLPEGEITDWPDVELRNIYWDDNHHLDRIDTLKRALRQAAFYKINGFVIKLNGHFEYASAPALVEPYALSPAELQELTDYGLRYYVQLIPYLDAPAHISFILKHPEYEVLREFPDSNYELCVTDPDSYKLLDGMYQNLLDANHGVNYFVLSTDESYYVGLAKNAQCDEQDRAKQLGSVGKLLAEFLAKAGGYLHDRGRTVVFWGEYPLKPSDIASLPSYLVNGEVYGPEYDPLFKAHGIRQMIYTSTEGVEPLFPNYYLLPPQELFNPLRMRSELDGMFDHISFDSSRTQSDLIGVFVAGWGDEGLHPATFWLGYATGAAWGWHPGSPSPMEARSSFYRLFYGPGVTQMGRLYQLMSTQAEFWNSSWEIEPSTVRKPIFGNSDRIFNPRRPAKDQTLPLPPVPEGPYLRLRYDWGQANARRVALAKKFMTGNDELEDLIHENVRQANFNRYSLEVYLSIAGLYRQNLEMIEEMAEINQSLKQAEVAAADVRYADAVQDLDRALDLAEAVRDQRNEALHNAVQTWYQSWFPRAAEANGRRYLNQIDDVKDHLPGRTVDMRYLVYREMISPMGTWFDQVETARNQYAQAHGLPATT
ncbi:MAG: beta-N-acetylhexosaminidase, partial [Terriglobia bacterium]